MKKLLVISFLAITASLAYAGSDCGDKCDKGKKGEKTGITESSVIVAGADCDKKCDKKDTEKTGMTESSIIVAGADCDKKCGKETFSAADYAIA